MSGVREAAESVWARVEKHGKSAFNEQNTCSILIEPLLASLGWDLTDPKSVDRQYRVYDGTRLDFALMLAGKPALFVEAKAAGQSLDHPPFIAQAINYANNEGVLWCVLTNGLLYRVYKTNEPVAMPEKLMFEANLAELGDLATQGTTCVR